MQENALGRFGGHTMGAPMPLPQHLIQFGVDRPRISFSEVLSFDLNHEAIHFIHQPGGSDGPRPFSHGQPAVLRRRFSRQRLPACSEAAMRSTGASTNQDRQRCAIRDFEVFPAAAGGRRLPFMFEHK